MSFIKNDRSSEPLIDNVFNVVKKAAAAKEKYGADNVVDATIGSLGDDNGTLVAFDTVFTPFRQLSNQDYARYAEFIAGNDEYLRAMEKWIFNGLIDIPHRLIATPGGTGAVSTTICNVLNKDEILLIPDIGWSSYRVMAIENNINAIEYQLFDENGQFYLDSIKENILMSIKRFGRAVIIINSPCHNPTGHSIDYQSWVELFAFFNSLNGEVILINDIAYIDYAYDIDVKKYMSLFNSINNNVLVTIAYSCSKAFTSYGLRCGVLAVLHPQVEIVDSLFNVFEKSCRALWSNVCNSAMCNVTNILEHHINDYLSEKHKYIELLRKRSLVFLNDAKSCNLTIYPYVEGFFITLKLSNAERDILHEALIKQNIFTIKVNKGIRIGICSASEEKLKGLAIRIKNIMNDCL